MRSWQRVQALPVLTLLAFLIGTGVILQLWLLGAALEGFLGDKHDIALPAALGSVALLGVNLGFLSYVLRIDRHVRTQLQPSRPGTESGRHEVSLGQAHDRNARR